MKPGDLFRWNYPEEMPASCGGAEIFMITRVEGDSVDFLINGRLVKSWTHNWVRTHSKAIDEAR